MIFTTGPMYNRTRQCSKKYIVHQGGTSSGKTYTILQVAFIKCIENPGVIFTVVGQDIPNLKLGAMRMADQIYQGSVGLKLYISSFNQSDRKYIFKNGSILEFTAFEDEQDAKSGKRDYCFLNEANGIPWSIAWQIFIRTKRQCFIDYNPTTSFWAHRNLIGKENCEFIISDHWHNPFLSQETHDEIEGITDTDLWNVYARGNTGDIKGIIYPNWKECEAMPADCEEYIWGIDYGYTVDETAIVKIGIKSPKTAYLQELAYKPGLSEDIIAEVLYTNGFQPGMPFYSEHDPAKVAQLRSMGIPVWMANKDVKNGIMKVKQFEVFYTKDSNHIREERAGYKWTEVRSYDGSHLQIVNVPDPKYRAKHTLDAARYAIYTHFFRQ